MNGLMLNIAIMLIGSTSVALLTCVLYLKNKKAITDSPIRKSLPEDFEESEEMRIFSTPSKNDKYVVRSKEIEDEER